jgi:hypothetical protein
MAARAMSADNWAICPRCLQQAREANEAECTRVSEMYGTVPVEEFDAARAAIKPVDPEEYRTFREDYEFYGAEQGEVIADYEGRCSKCNLGGSFRTSKKFWPDAASRGPTGA